MTVPSMVGVRSTWKCILCESTAIVREMHRAGLVLALEIPRGWTIINNQSYCGRDHARAIRLDSDDCVKERTA